MSLRSAWGLLCGLACVCVSVFFFKAGGGGILPSAAAGSLGVHLITVGQSTHLSINRPSIPNPHPTGSTPTPGPRSRRCPRWWAGTRSSCSSTRRWPSRHSSRTRYVFCVKRVCGGVCVWAVFNNAGRDLTAGRAIALPHADAKC